MHQKARSAAVAAAICVPLPATSRDCLRPYDAQFLCDQKSLANADFFCNELMEKKHDPRYGKIASEWRYAILVVSSWDLSGPPHKSARALKARNQDWRKVRKNQDGANRLASTEALFLQH